MSKVISFESIRQLKESQEEDQAYKAKILAMDKLDLLDEMVRFQEERTQLGHLTPSMMIRGKILFKALEDSAETHELRLLTRSYRRHLELELAAFLEKKNTG